MADQRRSGSQGRVWSVVAAPRGLGFPHAAQAVRITRTRTRTRTTKTEVPRCSRTTTADPAAM